MNGISRGHFYNLDKIGKAPRTFYAGTRRLVSAEADVEWRREREAEAAPACKPRQAASNAEAA
jgi:hypothetical protein